MGGEASGDKWPELPCVVAGSATFGVLDPMGIPSADYITVVVAQGGTPVSGTVYIRAVGRVS